MSYGCLAANDKATAQKQMTENHRHQCEVFAKGWQTNTIVSSAVPAADTGDPTAAVYSNNQAWAHLPTTQL